MPESEKSLPDPHSKTKRKNDMLFLQKLGESLIKLPPSQLAQFTLPENLLDAIHFAHTLKSNEAKRRHLQYVGKIMRDIDVEAIQVGLKHIQYSKDLHATLFHQIEQWRDQLISGDDAILQKFLIAFPQTDIQRLRQLIRQAKKDHESQKNTGGETTLFRYLREILT